MSSIMRWRNGLMGLSSIAKAPVSHGVQNPMILRQSDASRCPGLQTPHADARRPPRERFSPSTLSGHCADRLRGRFLEVTGNRHDADYVPFAFFLGDVFVLNRGDLRRAEPRLDP